MSVECPAYWVQHLAHCCAIIVGGDPLEDDFFDPNDLVETVWFLCDTLRDLGVRDDWAKAKLTEKNYTFWSRVLGTPFDTVEEG